MLYLSTQMKKLFLLAAFIGLAWASNAQSYSAGTSIVTLGYGVPNFLALRFNILDVDNYNQKLYGPIYLKYEYLASDIVSVGVQLSYSQTDIEYDINYVDLNNQVQRGREGCTITNIGVYTDVNFYWIRQGPFVLYSGFGVGYNNFGYSEFSDDPNFNPSSFIQGVRNAIPIGAQLTAMGAKVDLSNGLGVYSSFGVGKSLFELGVCYGFGTPASR